MEFVRIIEGYDHLWAVKEPEKEFDDLKNYFHIEKVSEAMWDTFEDADELEELILEFPYTEHLDELFQPLSASDMGSVELSRRKARSWDRDAHASWLRIYAIRLERNVYIVTGGAIKLTQTMLEREHTALELSKLDKCKSYLKDNAVFDKDSFIDLNFEGQI